MEKSQVLWTAANEFAEKTRKLSTILEVAVVGSVAGGDPYPDDLDMAVIVRDFDEIEILAKYARQMSRYYHGWEVFLFNEDLSPLGRICHRRECPSRSVDCAVPGCGHPPHVRVVPNFRYDERVFLTSYQKRGLSQPKRCPDCIEREHMGGFRH